MKSLGHRIFIGGQDSCTYGLDPAVVHACKDPCHRKAVGYTGNLAKDHPNYLSLTVNSNLYLNLIDPPVPLFQLQSFKIFLDFACFQLETDHDLLIHCNEGKSRAPSLALLLLAKRGAGLPNDSYPEARKAFEEICPDYAPNLGIVTYLTEHWSEIQ